jgi:excisionase family DNA binding protein
VLVACIEPIANESLSRGTVPTPVTARASDPLATSDTERCARSQPKHQRERARVRHVSPQILCARSRKDAGGRGTVTSVDGPESSYPEILTTAMAAEMLHVHVEYLRRMVREGRIPAHRFPGGREIRFVRDELIQWVRAQPGEDRSPSAADKANIE